MVEKKEILDYLRNQQKAAEIEAKVNGINLWVLLGAIGVIGWTLLNYQAVDLSPHREFGARILILVEALYLFSWLCSPTRGIREGLRFSNLNADEIASPFLILIEGLWLSLPPVLHVAVLGWNVGAIIIGIWSTLVVVGIVGIILMHFFGKPKGAERFPKPTFSASPKGDLQSDLVLGFGYACVAVLQVFHLSNVSFPPVDVTKTILLLVALYLLILIAIRRRRGSHSIHWTYELETDVLVGELTPEAALRRIEHRALGPRLEDVMNRFFDELDKKLVNFDSLLSESSSALQLIGEVPREYQAERSDRVLKATLKPKQILDEMLDDVEQFSSYLKTLNARKLDSRVTAAMENLATRKDAYRDRVDSAKRTLDSVVNSALS